MNITQNTLNILEKRIESLNAPQKLHFQKFREASKFVSCLPVGCGKGYLVFTALLDKIINTDEKNLRQDIRIYPVTLTVPQRRSLWA